ncbi:hypothetical protein H2O64_15575 [Kordia sp. YSTF-M3]|uniref:Uncharacterized protein n=1 Tax=Kordia aestuariivivens TaxID=2759037 RepID=A0ABR7QC41_9FLAO|nr:hypothetical protein [Kordia aestuariivivens]MBC8756097.1 hypothetical protein [Kordia aestuariivivens]
MNGIGIIALIIGGIIILVNIIIHFSNLIKIIQYTFATNSLGNYWEYFFKNNFSARALISSLIALVIAIFIFFIIAPFVLYRKYVLKNDIESQLKSGLMLEYLESYPHVNKEGFFHTNIDFLNIKDIQVPITGNLRVDLVMIMGAISEKCEANNKTVDYAVMQKTKLSNKSVATIPVMLSLNDREYPMYLIYTDEHIDQYKELKKSLFQSGYKDCIYFSTEKI